jgi:hypothetical protein
MKGHEPLLAMRRAGFTPLSVHFTVGPDPLCTDWPKFGNRASVEIEPSDAVSRLDLRYVVGLEVHVLGHDEVRVVELHGACIAAKASRVISSVHEPRRHAVTRLLDSAGKLEGTWPN